MKYVTLAEEKANEAKGEKRPIDEGLVVMPFDEPVEATASSFGESFRHLFSWELCDLMLEDMLVTGCLYLFMSILRTHVLSESMQNQLNGLSAFFAKYMNMIALSFFVGFFTQTAVNRWYAVGRDIPGTNKVIKRFILGLKNDSPDGEQKVCLYTRYVLLMWMLIFRLISPPFQKMFPTLEYIRDNRWLTEDEYSHLVEVGTKEGPKAVPLEVFDWLNDIVLDFHDKGLIVIANCTRCFDSLQELKKGGGNLLRFVYKNTPSVLARLVSLVVYVYGAILIFSSYPSKKEHSGWALVWGRCFFLPQMLPYLVFLLWLKVGRIVTNPFGSDREDIDLVNMFKENVRSAYRIRRKYGNMPIEYHVSPEGLPAMRYLAKSKHQKPDGHAAA